MRVENAVLLAIPEPGHPIEETLTRLLKKKVDARDLEVHPVLGYPKLFDFFPPVSDRKLVRFMRG